MKIAEKITLGSLKALASLPLAILYSLSDVAFLILFHIIGYRRKVVKQNLVSSFPEKTPAEINKIEKEFYHYLCDQIVETLKLLSISDKTLAKRVKVENYEEVNNSLRAGTNAVLLLGHYGNWEWVQEITRYFVPGTHMVSIYHPLNNKLWNDIFNRVRSRWGADILPMKQAPKFLLNKANQPWVCGFIADAYTWYKNSDNCIPFLNHDTWFIYGPEEIGRKLKADFFYLEMKREKRGHYKIIFSKLQPRDMQLPFPYTREFWKKFEENIRNNPPYWLWSHKRWK